MLWSLGGILICGASAALTGLFFDWLFGTEVLVWLCFVFGMIGGLLFQRPPN